MKKVFIASRFDEFKKIREKLRKELLDCNLYPIDLNDNQAVALPPLSRSLQNIRESNIVILLIGDSYGIPPKGELKSYTHLEYEEAMKYEVPVYSFAIGQSYENNQIKYSTIQNMKEWQETLENNHTLSMFCDDEDIGLTVHKIITSVYSVENKTWLDEDSGLMWQVKIDATEEHGRLQWNDIFKYCDNKNKENYGGFNDWRVPTIDELETLVTDVSNPNSYGYDEESFIQKPLLYSMAMKYGRFWSSTSNLTNHNFAYGINFNRKRENSQSKRGNKEKYKTRYVRCVRLWRDEDIQKEFLKIQDSNDKEILTSFIKKYPNNKYYTTIKIKLQELYQKEEDHLSSLSVVDKKLLEKFPNDKNTPKYTLLFNAIKQGFFDEMKYEALIELKKMMQDDEIWKESSHAKNANKDKDYQKTIDVINILKSTTPK